MELARINEVVTQYTISSRTLRYYEQVGLLWSERPGGKQQRYYSPDAIERLEQIIVLRKLQIPIKDIIQIYEDSSTQALIQAFVNKLNSLDGEINALQDLRELVDDFLQKMIRHGITKISAIPFLYEETEKRLENAAAQNPVSYNELVSKSRRVFHLGAVKLIRLPPMRMLSSQRKDGSYEELDGERMENMFTPYNFTAQPGMRSSFYRALPGDEWLMMTQIPEGFENNTIYRDIYLPGGLYAVASCHMEDMDDAWELLRQWAGKQGRYTTDNVRNEMFEETMPWELANHTKIYQQDLYLPIVETEESRLVT